MVARLLKRLNPHYGSGMGDDTTLWGLCNPTTAASWKSSRSGFLSSRFRFMKLLIEQGAMVHAKQQYHHDTPSTFWCEMQGLWDATSLHISSMFCNTEAIQTLLDHYGGDITKSLSCRDSNGRLPLHWVAAGPGSFECRLSGVNINNRIIDALKLLLAGSDINARDNRGETALHYAIRGHASCGGSKHFDAVLRFLLENGAHADAVDIDDQTVLHKIAAHCMAGDPIDTPLMDILLSHRCQNKPTRQRREHSSVSYG